MASISDEIKKKLLIYQVSHTENLIRSLKKYNRVLDLSETGTGKTYCGIGACKSLKLKPLIICPKSVIPSWKKVLDFFEIDYYGISNYESIQNCKYYSKNSNKKVTCPFITKEEDKCENEKINEFNEEKEKELLNSIPKKESNILNNDKKKYVYNWLIPDDMIIIFDEAHKCKNLKTTNSLLLFTYSITNTVNGNVSKIMLLSATIVDKPESFALFGFILGLYSNIRKAKTWLSNLGKLYDLHEMEALHHELFNEYASSMRIKELGDLFPKNQVIAECFDMDCKKEIQEMYKIIDDAIERLKEKEQYSVAIAQIQYARMRVEMLKVPTYIELGRKYTTEGNAVAIFVNFTESLKTIADELKTSCVIYGDQTLEERQKNIDDFNSDKSHIIICNIQSGNCGISLHDLHGNFPRVSIISPSWNATQILQVLGRTFRANGKTPVRQRIVYCKDTVEEHICDNMKEKIINIALINDGHEDSYKIEGLMDNTSDKEELSEFDKVFLKLQSLEAKKGHLIQELKETDEEIKSLQYILNNCI